MRLAPAYRVCVICSGNICRSPMGEFVLRSMLSSAGLGDRVVVDSAGTGDWHEGDPADPRTVRALKDHGYDGTHHRARQFRPEWFSDRDLIVVADEGHIRNLRRWAPGDQASAKVRLLREFDPTAVDSGTLEVDDPYYGDAEDFDRCLTAVERACRGLVGHLHAELARLAELAQLAQLAQLAEPDQLGELDQLAGPAESAEPDQLGELHQLAGPAESAEPDQLGELHQLAGPAADVRT